MINDLGYYNPNYYALEGLIQLEKALGLAGRIHRGYDQERRAFKRGEYINISRPSVFTAQDEPSTAQDLEPDSVQMRLNYWRGVKFGLTDKELAFTGEQMINDHIRPAAVAIADDIDQKLAAEYHKVPWQVELASGTAMSSIADITNAYQTLFDNKAPMGDEDNLHFMISGASQNALQQISAFTQWQGSGEAGVNSQMRGQLGKRYGFNIFANQNTPSHTTGAIADATGALTANAARGATSISFDGVTAAAAFKKGDTFVIAGSTQRYSLTANISADGSGVVTGAAIFPPLVQDYLDNDVITWNVPSSAKTSLQNLAFHKGFAALATAPLSEAGNSLGAKIATITDPITQLSLRSRVWYDGNNSKVMVGIDCLYGVQVLDANLAVRVGDFA